MIGIESYPLKRYLLDRSRGKRRDYVPHIYELASGRLAGLTAGTAIPLTRDIDTDAPFLWLMVMGVARALTATISAQVYEGFPATIDLRIGGAGGRSISKRPIPFTAFAPWRPQPHYIGAPQLIAGGSQVFASVVPQITTANDHAIAIQLIGCKVFGWGPR